MTKVALPVIRRLEGDVVARIAAGEVIDRPAAVVKELFENALDAGAHRITVEVDGHLERMVRVSDDGHGMDEGGVMLAIERHATSKIERAEDLARVQSLGFRGEGLASVAAVSRLTIVSASQDGDGVEMVAEAGHIQSIRPAGRARGTTIEVRDLFFNTPVRRRFQRTATTELQQAARLIQSYALSRRDVHLKWIVDGREILNLPPAGSLTERMTALFGRERVARMIPVEGRNDVAAIEGFLGAPEDSRARGDQQTFFVNGRLVTNPVLRQAVRQAYGNLIPYERHPFVVLSVELDPARVDVNIHPTKKEVRFSNDRDLFPALVSLIGPAVKRHVPRFRPGDAGDGLAVNDMASLFGGGNAGGASGDSSAEASFVYDAPSGDDSRAGATGPAGTTGPGGATVLGAAPGVPTILPFAGSVTGGAAFKDQSEAGEAVLADLWQLHRSYILASIRGGLLVIDQHAAHERVLFEEAILRIRSGRPATQELLFPQVVPLTAEEFHVLLDVQPTLEKFGFHIELFGGTTVVVHGIPAGLTRWRQGDLLHDLIAMYDDQPTGAPLEERVARSYACRAAVKAGEPLTPVEMNELIDRLFATTLPQGDPHGRPTFLRMSIDDIHRRFGRSS
jgi:DNA mismatch repair protein MutL